MTSLSGILSTSDLKNRTRLNGLKSEVDETIEYWINLASSLIGIYDLDTGKEGFNTNFQFAIQKYAEKLWLDNQETSMLIANSPFRSEKTGSYSWTRFDPRGIASADESDADDFPSIVRMIIKSYLAANDIVSSTKVFREIKFNSSEDKEYHDFLDAELGELAYLYKVV